MRPADEATTDLTAVLAGHWRQSTGMSHGSPDTCACGVETRPVRGDDDVSDRRARAFAAHIADALAPVIRAERAAAVEAVKALADDPGFIVCDGSRGCTESSCKFVRRLRAALDQAKGGEAALRAHADALAPVIRAERAAALGSAALEYTADCDGQCDGVCEAVAHWLTARAEAERRGES